MRYTKTVLCALVATAFGGASAQNSILNQIPSIPTMHVSTLPPNMDVNPYGITFVPDGYQGGGALQAGDILISNFNNSSNLQGTGTTIVRVSPNGKTSVFFQGIPGQGFTTALGIFKDGYVLVGNTPTNNGNFDTIGRGSLIVLNSSGKRVGWLTDKSLLQGPWDLTINDQGEHSQVFVSNVLSGTVTRLNVDLGSHFVVDSATQIASGYLHQANLAALVVGPTGLAYDSSTDTLFVASTGDNAIYSVSTASASMSDGGMGSLVYKDNKHLHGPLALVLVPGGNLLTANGDAVNADASQPSEMVEFTRGGQFVNERSVNLSGEGGAFGIALGTVNNQLALAAVDDILNIVDIWMVGPQQIVPHP